MEAGVVLFVIFSLSFQTVLPLTLIRFTISKQLAFTLFILAWGYRVLFIVYISIYKEKLIPK